jgi:hypothetical protein
MKTTLIKNILRTKLIILLIFAFGCSEDFLNDPQPTDRVSEELVFSSRRGSDAFMAGILRRMRGQFVADAHDAGGLNSMLYARTVKGNDVIQANTWFNFDYANDNREPTYRRVSFTWNFSYRIIGQLNGFIKGVEESEALADEDKDELIGQGKALRAYYYHQLVLEFCPAYSVDPNYPAPPIYKEPTDEAKPMSTTQEVYNFILEDLTDAVDRLSDNRLDKSFVNYRAANAFLAQVYQVLGQWENAEAAAREAYGGDINAALEGASYGDGFSSLDNPEWIWGLPQYDDQSAYYYSAPHAQADHYVLSYQATYFNGDFVALFSDTDVRNLFVAGAYGTTPTHWAHYITTKFQFAFDSDIPVIRTPEMILIEAEAKYRNGFPDDAHDLLFALQQDRDPNAVKSTNTGDDLLEEILVERRKELYAENGIEWFDAKRLDRGIPRTGVHRVAGAAALQPSDKRFFLKIPQAEIDANDKIDESVNANR